MFFTMPCPSCGKSLKVRSELVGRSARCPYCRATVTVAAPEEKPADAPAIQASPTAPSSGAAAKAATRPRAAAPLSVTADVDVAVLWHILAGIAGTVLFYLALWPFAWSDGKMTYIGRLFIGTSTMAQGGWVPITEIFLFFWAIGMLVEKWLKIRRQQRGLLYDVLPVGIGETITLSNIDRFIDHIRGLPKDSVGSFLVTRCVRGLEHFRVRKSAADTATMLSSQSDLDASSVDSSYTMFHVFIWAIPILGFLGTVIGVSTAVGSFTGTLEGSSDIGAMKAALKGITGGLATAFDTTLVALAMAMILTFPVSGLQKFEGDLVGQVDEYTNENLLRRLDDGLDGGAERGIGASRAEAKRVFEEIFGSHRAQLEAWHDKLGSIGSQLTAQVKQGWAEVNATLVAEHERQAERVATIDALVAKTAENVAAVATDTAAARERAAGTLTDAAVNVERYTASLQKALGGVADALAALEGRQIVIEALPATRPWWSFLRGRNGSEHS
jgi:hypothetical protein